MICLNSNMADILSQIINFVVLATIAMQHYTKISKNVATKGNLKVWTPDGRHYDNTPSDDCGLRRGKNTSQINIFIRMDFLRPTRVFFGLVNTPKEVEIPAAVPKILCVEAHLVRFG